MSNPVFHFLQFSVRHDKCAMRVGTDSVLLGAWVDVRHTFNVLDVGTGTGVVALMIAQRNLATMIDAIDIDMDACEQALENVEQSPFHDRIQVLLQSFFDYSPEKKYDLVVSNPPYFQNALPSPDDKRNVARHNDTLPFQQLIEHAIPLLSENGRIALILPMSLSNDLDFFIATHRLFELRRTIVVTVEGLKPKRFLVEITPKSPYTSDNHFKTITDPLVLETKEHQRTVQFQTLINDFIAHI